MTIRSLVERGTYEIDAIVGQPTWDTIDMVQHRGRDGKLHLYSSKPPLLATLLAGEYWLINRFSGATLRDNPYEIGRFMLFTFNILPLMLMYVLLAQLVERFGTTDWGRIFVVAAATLGTFLNTFAVVLNNHIIAAVSAAVTIYLLVRIAVRWRAPLALLLPGRPGRRLHGRQRIARRRCSGLTGLMLLWRAPRETLIAFVPAWRSSRPRSSAPNWIAHARLSPPYAFRSNTDPSDNWYNYTYTVNGREMQSYWLNRQGIDRGEPSKVTYAFHTLIGHHGIFSLTPIWLLSVAGHVMWLVSPDKLRRDLALLVLSVSVICLIFFIGMRPLEDRNYGGMTSGFRWVFWCAPLWLVVMIPAADRLARSTRGPGVRGCPAVVLGFVASAIRLGIPGFNRGSIIGSCGVAGLEGDR